MDQGTVPQTRAYGDTPVVAIYVETNDTNPLNALEFVLKDSGKLFFDDIILFSANINYNAETGRVYVLNNPNVQFLLDNNEQFLQPLRKRGMKVILGILGNHDAAGVAQLSDMAAASLPRSWPLIAMPTTSTRRFRRRVFELSRPEQSLVCAVVVGCRLPAAL